MPPEVLKKTRSPCISCSFFIFFPNWYCSLQVRGISMLYTESSIMHENAEQSMPIFVLPPYLYGMPYQFSRKEISFSLVTCSTTSSIIIAYLNCSSEHFSISDENTAPGTSVLPLIITGLRTRVPDEPGFIEMFSRKTGSPAGLRGACLVTPPCFVDEHETAVRAIHIK